MNIKSAKLEIIFFKNQLGSEPVRSWLKKLSKEDKREIGENIKTVQFGWPLGMPLVGSLGNSLWEVRVRLTSKKIARVIFFMDGNIMVLVNGFIKKSQKTPISELELAKKRKKLYETEKQGDSL